MRTVANWPGFNRPSVLGTSASTTSVRAVALTLGDIRTTVPAKFLSGNAVTCSEILWPDDTFPIDCSGTSIRKRKTDVRMIVAIFEFGVFGEMYSPTSATRSEIKPLIGDFT